MNPGDHIEPGQDHERSAPRPTHITCPRGCGYVLLEVMFLGIPWYVCPVHDQKLELAVPRKED